MRLPRSLSCPIADDAENGMSATGEQFELAAAGMQHDPLRRHLAPVDPVAFKLIFIGFLALGYGCFTLTGHLRDALAADGAR
jgi:hypothetical protein